MQLMPATAKAMAVQAGVDYDLGKLTSDAGLQRETRQRRIWRI